MAAQIQLEFNGPLRPPADRLIKLRDVEREIADLFHAESRPSRNTIIGWIEDGTLLGRQLGSGNNYYVWESSLDRFRRQLLDEAVRYAA